jgi:hypothetical protein
LPFASAINSSNWYDVHTDYVDVGEETLAPRPYFKGNAPLGMLGQHFCGSQTQFEKGALTTDPPLATDPNGVPTCCSELPPIPASDRQLIGRISLAVVQFGQVAAACCRGTGALPHVMSGKWTLTGPLAPYSGQTDTFTYTNPSPLGVGNIWIGTLASPGGGLPDLQFLIGCSATQWIWYVLPAFGLPIQWEGFSFGFFGTCYPLTLSLSGVYQVYGNPGYGGGSWAISFGPYQFEWPVRGTL